MTEKETHNIRWNGEDYSRSRFISFLKMQLKQAGVKDWQKDIYVFALSWLDDNKDTFEVQTSGSTGKAKTIVLQRTDMIKSAEATGKALGIKKGDTALLCLPAKYIAGKMMIVRAFVLGLDLYISTPSVDCLKNISTPINFCALIPLQLQYALDHGLYKELNKIDMIIVGGAPLPNAYIDQLEALKAQVYATYGMTETITHIALKSLNGKQKSNSYQCLDLYKVAQDDRGCLIIKTAERQWVTNDLVHLSSPVKFDILGRIDFIINSGGLKINPQEIEREISHLIQERFMISYKEDTVLGQRVVLLIEGNKDTLDEKEILKNIRQVLPSNKMPKDIIFVEELFYTDNKKIAREKNRLAILHK